MNLEPTDVIVFNDSLTEGYKPGVENTVKVEDLLNKLELLPKIRMMTQNIKCIQKADGTLIEGGHVKVSLNVEHDEEPLTNI